MKNRLETSSYIAALVASIVFTAFFGQLEYDRYRHPQPPARAARESPVGKTVSLQGVSFAAQGQPQAQSRTLVLAISSTCRFCKASEPFYQQLAAHNSGKLRIVAVLPQPIEEARSYVKKSIAPGIQVVSSELAAIDVEGTPTLLLVDGQGKVQQAWFGKLDAKGEEEVRALVM